MYTDVLPCPNETDFHQFGTSYCRNGSIQLRKFQLKYSSYVNFILGSSRTTPSPHDYTPVTKLPD